MVLLPITYEVNGGFAGRNLRSLHLRQWLFSPITRTTMPIFGTCLFDQ